MLFFLTENYTPELKFVWRYLIYQSLTFLTYFFVSQALKEKLKSNINFSMMKKNVTLMFESVYFMIDNNTRKCMFKHSNIYFLFKVYLNKKRWQMEGNLF